jgi:hypothetical protein
MKLLVGIAHHQDADRRGEHDRDRKALEAVRQDFSAAHSASPLACDATTAAMTSPRHTTIPQEPSR